MVNDTIANSGFVDGARLRIVDTKFVIWAVAIRPVRKLIMERKKIIAQTIFKFLHIRLLSLAEFEFIPRLKDGLKRRGIFEKIAV